MEQTPTLLPEQKERVLQEIKDHVKSHDLCSVRWAIAKVAGEKFGDSQHNREKIAAAITKSGRFIKESSNEVRGDWNISRNPQYKLSVFNVVTVLINILIFIITAFYSTCKSSC